MLARKLVRLKALSKASVILFLVLLTLASLFLVCGCGKSVGVVGRYSGRVRVSGSTPLLPLIQEASIEFMDANPRTKVDVQGGGSSVGITQLKSGIVNIANSSRELKGDETGWGLVDHKIAFDIIAIIVNPNVPVRNLTSDQVKAVFTGEVRNWKALGGPDEEIIVVVRDQASGTREMFDEKALGSTKDRPVGSEPSAIECSSNGVVREVVANTRNSIGYLSYGFINRYVRAVKVNDVPADVANAISGRYPMARWLHMLTKGQTSDAAKGFIDFVLSERFQNKVVSQEYIPVRDVLKQ
jgi:phosphate transport system substrate-binding protein